MQNANVQVSCAMHKMCELWSEKLQMVLDLHCLWCGKFA